MSSERVSDLPDVVALWRDAYHAERARREAVEAELARVQAAGVASTVAALPEAVEAAVVRYSFGAPDVERQTRTFARTQIAAGADPVAVAQYITRGAYTSDED